MFEHHSQPIVTRCIFILRLLKSIGVVLLLVSVSLFVGTFGYKMAENMTWIDAFYNASLIMSGMGPASEMKTDGGKIFASLYSLYSGLVLIAVTGLLLTPIFHRVLHKFHHDKK